MTDLILIPRDGFFCKDGRGWHTSASGRGHALPWPWPSTIQGALRTAWGRSEEARSGISFTPQDWLERTAAISLGPTVAVRRTPGGTWSTDGRTWPVPADALWLEGGEYVHRLDPRPPAHATLGMDDAPARDVLWSPTVASSVKPLPSPRWWRDADMVRWLAGERVRSSARDGAPNLPARLQVHVTLSADTSTAVDGALYAHEVIETLSLDEEWGIAARVTLPTGGATWTPATLGSDGRLATVERPPNDLFGPPAALLRALDAGPRGLRLACATPACFNEGWLPDGFTRDGDRIVGELPGIDATLVLRAALVPRPAHISGWDIANNRPKPIARMAPPGAVYYVVRSDGGTFTPAHASALWLAAIGQRTDEGFGRVVPGTWNPNEQPA